MTTQIDLDKLEQLANDAGGKHWIRLFGERTVYDRMEDGCRGMPMVSTGHHPPTADQASKLDFVAAANPAVVLELVRRLRAAAAPIPDGMALAPEYRGYAHLGMGLYVINHSAAGEAPELAISIATDAEKAGRVVGDERDNVPGALVMPEDIAVRMCFANVAGLDALEGQLRKLRAVHFPASVAVPTAVLTDEQILEICMDKAPWFYHNSDDQVMINLARAIEAASSPNATLVEALQYALLHLRGEEHDLDGVERKARAALAAAGVEVKP